MQAASGGGKVAQSGQRQGPMRQGAVWRGPPSRIAALTGVPTRTSIRTRGGTSSGRANRAPRIPGPRESAATPSPRLKPLRSRAERASVSPVPRQRALSLRSWLRPRCLLRRSTEVHRPRADYWSGRLQVADVALDGLPQRREAGATERRSNRRHTTALERRQAHIPSAAQQFSFVAPAATSSALLLQLVAERE